MDAFSTLKMKINDRQAGSLKLGCKSRWQGWAGWSWLAWNSTWCVDNKGRWLHMEWIKAVWRKNCFIFLLCNFCKLLFYFVSFFFFTCFPEQNRKPVIWFIFCLLLQYLHAFLMCVFITGTNVWWVSSSGGQAARSARWPLGTAVLLMDGAVCTHIKCRPTNPPASDTLGLFATNGCNRGTPAHRKTKASIPPFPSTPH